MRRLVCLGDSITDGERLFSPSGLGCGYVGYLDEILNGKEKQIEIINRGVNGFIVDRLAAQVQRDCIAFQPDIVTVLIGINDIGVLMNTDRTLPQKEQLMAKFEELYRKLLKEIRQHTQGHIILMEPFVFPFPREYSNWIPYVQKISAGIGDMAKEFSLPYVLLHNKLNKAAQQEGYAAVTTDGIHLTQYGHQILAKQLVPHIQGRGEVMEKFP